MNERHARKELKSIIRKFIYEESLCEGCDEFMYGCRSITFDSFVCVFFFNCFCHFHGIRYIGFALWHGLDERVEEVAKAKCLVEYYARGPMAFLMLNGGTGTKHLFLNERNAEMIKTLRKGKKTMFFIRLHPWLYGLKNWIGKEESGVGDWSDYSIRCEVEREYEWVHERLDEAHRDHGLIGPFNEELLMDHKRENRKIKLDADALIGAVLVDVDDGEKCGCHRTGYQDDRDGLCFTILQRLHFSFTLRYEEHEEWEKKVKHFRMVGYDYILRVIRSGATERITSDFARMMKQVDI